MRNYEAALLVVTFLVAAGVEFASAGCSRRFKQPPDDDCSSVNVSCLVYNDDGSGGLTISLPEYPVQNARTCYRTCIDEDVQICKASLTGVHNSPLTKDPSTLNYSLQRMYSPNYNDDKNYRKSTICRYNVKCDDNKLLSYNFIHHTLENRTNVCGNSCVDHVSLDLINFGEEKITTCGTEADFNQINLDGATEISVEFVANRYEQDSGFMLYVWCSDPSFDINAQIENSTSSESKRAAEDNSMCERPSNAPRPTFDPVRHISKAIEGSREAITAENTTHVILHPGDTLKYTKRKLVIKRGRFGKAVRGSCDVISDSVTLLYVSNRIKRRTVFYTSSKATFQGYGELWISGSTAYLLQVGMKPIYVPTNEESEIIKDLEKGLALALKNTDNFDVYDELDAEEEPQEGNKISGRKVIPQLSNTDLERLKSLARRYSRACNGLLRSVACAYQDLVLRRDCITGERTTTNTTATATTSTTSSATATAKATASATTKRKGRALMVENSQNSLHNG